MMDGDLQHPPELIPQMLNKFYENYDVVQMVKKDQGKRNILQKILSFFFYKIFNKLSKINLSSNVSDFRLLSKKATLQLKNIKEKNRFIRGLSLWIGFRYTELEYKVGKRIYNKSKYNIIELFKLASFGIFAFSDFPLKISFYTGILIAAFSFLYGLFAIIKKIFFYQAQEGYTDIISFITFIGGMQLIFIGVIGMYISKIFEQVRNRPLYIIDETKNFEDL